MRNVMGLVGTVGLVVLAIGTTMSVGGKSTAREDRMPYVRADSPEAAGRYFARIGGCNDCHTPGWGATGGKTAEADWLTGGDVGYNGPWGTTYAANLRLSAQKRTERQWVAMFRRPAAERPPMPWMNYKTINERDLRDLYRFINGLGPKGKEAPDFVPPGQMPKTVYMHMVPQQPGK